MSEVAPASAAIAPTPATPTTTPTKVNDGKNDDNNSKTTTTTTTTNAENEMTERNVPVNDPPVTGASSMQMPPLVVKQRGVAKPGVQPTAGSVSFDYTGPPVKVTNGTVLDLVTQFGIPNAWLAVLKLKGFNVNKESAEALMPIKRFRDRVRKLKQTAETLKSRSDDSATFLAKEFVCALNNVEPGSSNAKTNAQSGSNQKESSSTDAVIESILRQAATEVKANSTNAAPTKPKRSKKNNTQKQGVPPSNAGPGSSHPNSTIDDVVSSVMNKIRNNEPFEGEDRNNGEVSFANVELPFNSVQQQPHQQMVFAPNLQPGQTIYMVQDESMIPLIQQQQQPQQILQAPPSAASPFKGKAKGRKSKAAAAAAAASQPSGSQIPQQQAVQMPNYLQQQQIAPTIRSPTSQSMPQQVTVLTVPRNQNGAGNTSYSIPAGYSTAKFDNNTTVIFSNINDLIRAQQTPNVNNQQNQIAKVITYQPGMTLPPGATIMSNANPQGMSPSTYQQIVTQQQPQQSMQPQYVVTQTPALQLSSSPPKPQLQSAADDKAGEGSNKKSPRRKSIKTAKREDVALSNFNDSDFEELASPKRKDASKKAPKKEKKEPAEKKSKAAAAAAPAAAPAPQPKAPAKKGRKRKNEAPESEHEEGEAEHTDVESSDVEGNKSQLEKEVAQLKRQLQAERSRHYTQKRRATKLDDDYKRVLDRLQQTELNLALQMSECERLQAELKKLGDENDNLTAKVEGNDAPKNAAKPTRPASKRTSVINKKRASPSPSPTPGTSQKKTPKGKATTASKASTAAAAATTAPSTSSPSTNNRKRGRPSTNAAATESSTDNKQSSPSPQPANEEDKPAFNPNDFIPRRAAAAKRIRYF